ncbi:hypothetical protein ACFQT0_04175 [Hymenobacter humi]|uniref:Uncharacterized protein n=1 Tax=Hymenobacter humi TaxID=1411620 RepID=A0ABW2TZN4_9BACT
MAPSLPFLVADENATPLLPVGFFLFVAGLGPLRAQSFAWAKLARTDSDSVTVSRSVSATDKDGNTYVYVPFRDHLTVNGTVFTGTPHTLPR